MSGLDYIPGHTTHARRGATRHAFRYRVDYVLVDPDAPTGPALFSQGGWNVFSLNLRDYGSRDGLTGADWARQTLRAAGVPEAAIAGLRLLTQPRFLGRVFNPVSFWLAMDGKGLRAVIAEVNNTFGDRHSYLCHHADFAPIVAGETLSARKLMHVSPFQQVEGSYGFSFDIAPDKIAIRILHENGGEGVIATLFGPRVPLTNRAIAGAILRRPFGPFRTIGLIYWQALRLRLKGAPYRTRPQPPDREVSSCSTSPNA